MAALLEQLEHGASERARQAAAYKLAASDDPAAVSALLSRFDSHPVERVRRAATYGITAAVARETTAAPNTAVVDALVAKLNAPFVPALGAVCGTPAVLHALAEASPTPQLLHALSEFWVRSPYQVRFSPARGGGGGQGTSSHAEQVRYQVRYQVRFQPHVACHCSGVAVSRIC